MKKVVAICTDIGIFNNDKMFEEGFSAYGADWVFEFAQSMQKEGYECHTGDVAIEMIQKSEVLPSNVIVMQELDSKIGKKLIELGAKPLILTGFESPLYAPLFYDDLKFLAASFKHRILYQGAFSLLDSDEGKNHPLHFTSFSPSKLKPIIPWESRKEIVMVVGNKYCSLKFPISSRFDKFWTKFKVNTSKTYKTSLKNSIQDKRLEAIEYWGKLKKLDLYGMGWNKLKNLPLSWQFKLKKIISPIYKGTCGDKIETISNYKFAICFENTAYSGHITEKIINCFEAGVIPIYLGAPDVEKFIPKDAFIDVRDYSDFDELNSYIISLSNEEALNMINAGREFLTNESGLKFSNEYYANFIKNIVLESENKEVYRSKKVN